MTNEFLAALSHKLRFDSPQLSFCTHYSWFGTAKSDRLGIEQVYLFYNRSLALLSPNLLTFRVSRPGGGSERQHSRNDGALQIEESDGQGFTGRIAFLDSDILCYHASLGEQSTMAGIRATLLLPETEPRLNRSARFDPESRLLTIRALMPATDRRDPDPTHSLTLCIQTPEAFSCSGAIIDGVEVQSEEGGLDIETGGPVVITFTAEPGSCAGAEQTFVIGIGEGPAADKIESRMPPRKSLSSASSATASEKWLTSGLDKFTFRGIPKRLRGAYAKAAYQILSNTKAPRGQMGRYGIFPNRAQYCTHFLWDACFTNLGVEQFNERLASDFLIALCENQEADGKIPHFVCATWNRPGESQPPLIAWSAWRLYERFGNKELIRDVYEPLTRMVRWWFAKRDVDGDGVVEYESGLESGWDNSPRFDKGRVAAVDLNAYLNREMLILAKMAPVIARDGESAKWTQMAEEHARKVYARLFDREDGLFYDRLVNEDRLHKVLTPSSFTPLWTQMKMPRGLADEMIARYLINPKHFFGSRPFPVVAYSDRTYTPDHWWRGPVWPNIAWEMTEILRIHGYEKEHEEAVRRLMEMLTVEHELWELYNSATGVPMGSSGFSWTSAVLMDLVKG